MPAESGIRFGPYVLQRRIARGGMAEVFLAEQHGPGHDRRVAIKRILPHLANASDFIQMFLSEAKLAAQLGHPNIVHIYDSGQIDGDHFIAMEYVDGVHAGEVIKRGGRMPPAMVARIGADAAAALHYAHELRAPDGQPLGLVHRDVSPANLMVSFDGAVKLCDFAIAKAVALGDRQFSSPGVVKGKFAYMSPEQTAGMPLDGRSDVFALAIVLWELLAGRMLVPRGDAVAAMRAIRRGALTPIEEAAPWTPAGLAEAIAWGLATRREKRATAAELAQALEAFLAASPEPATPMQLGAWLRARFPRDPAGAAASDDEASGSSSPGVSELLVSIDRTETTEAAPPPRVDPADAATVMADPVRVATSAAGPADAATMLADPVHVAASSAGPPDDAAPPAGRPIFAPATPRPEPMRQRVLARFQTPEPSTERPAGSAAAPSTAHPRPRRGSSGPPVSAMRRSVLARFEPGDPRGAPAMSATALDHRETLLRSGAFRAPVPSGPAAVPTLIDGRPATVPVRASPMRGVPAMPAPHAPRPGTAMPPATRAVLMAVGMGALALLSFAIVLAVQGTPRGAPRGATFAARDTSAVWSPGDAAGDAEPDAVPAAPASSPTDAAAPGAPAQAAPLEPPAASPPSPAAARLDVHTDAARASVAIFRCPDGELSSCSRSGAPRVDGCTGAQCSFQLPVGNYEIAVELGGVRETRQIALMDDVTTSLDIVLRATARAARATTGRLTVHTRQRCAATVDDHRHLATPIVDLELHPGSHRLELDCGKRTIARRVAIAAGKTTELTITPR